MFYFIRFLKNTYTYEDQEKGKEKREKRKEKREKRKGGTRSN